MIFALISFFVMGIGVVVFIVLIVTILSSPMLSEAEEKEASKPQTGKS
jgi:hypothetical protein